MPLECIISGPGLCVYETRILHKESLNMAEKTTGEMQATLGLIGLTMNAMALIAP
jgi:hypothetical protein